MVGRAQPPEGATGPEALPRIPPDAARPLAVDGPYDFDESLRFVPFGPYDPTCRRGPGRLWKAGRSPDGPVTVRLARTPTAVDARAWGPGAAWALARAGDLAGLRDEPARFEPAAGPIASLARRGRAIRLPRSPWVFDGLTEYVLQQRVTFRDAARAHRRLVEALGTPAPGPPGLLLPLAPSDWLRLADGDLRRAGIDGQRARALRAAARAARLLDSAFARDADAARRLLASVPGCGPWTVEITMGFVLGDADAVPTGDLHLPHEVGWALDGEPGADDERMLELLEPFRGQRFRVLRLLLATGRIRLGRSAGRTR
ncbi:MAG TPA: DNA-3-methyladenine glycosylase 2 family protein [Vicinamibacteria bacterium]|nr:DNA-3-methyladenine glycosylase 2 family protein [Vicinamibacteria bacterium]